MKLLQMRLEEDHITLNAYTVQATLKNIDIYLNALKSLIIAAQRCRTRLARLAWSQ